MKTACLTVLILIMITYPTMTEKAVRKANKLSEQQKIYRCCPTKCYLLNSIIDQTPIKEIPNKEVDYSNNPVIFNSRYCSI